MVVPTFEKIILGDVSLHFLRLDQLVLPPASTFLLPEEQVLCKSFKSANRKKEFLATRFLRTQLFGLKPIQYSAIGAPTIEGKHHISISHCKEQVGMACCTHFPIGLDMEPIDEKVLRVKQKFLSKREENNLQTQSAVEMTKVWSGKEALYKLAGRKRIIFSDHLFLHKKNENQWHGELNFPESHREVELAIKNYSGTIVSVNVSAVHVAR